MDKERIILAQSFKMKNGQLDDDYTLYDNGDVLHEYDRSIYPSGINKTEMLRAENLSDNVKQRLLSETSEENEVDVRKLLNL